MMPSRLPLPDLAQIARSVDRLPSPSAVVVDLLHHIDDEDMSSVQLARIIARDQSLVVRLLRIANSPFYGLRGRVDSIADAIAVLGLRAVRSLAAMSGVAGSLAGITPANFDTRLFWRHSIAVALAARALARHQQQPEGVAYVAGLLHDIGSLMLAASFPKHWEAVLAWVAETGSLLNVAEQEVLGSDHALIGGHLAERWHFPAPICAAITGHHRPGDGEANSLTGTVHVADVLAHALDLVGDPGERVGPLDAACWARLRLDQAGACRIFAAIENEFAVLSAALFH